MSVSRPRSFPWADRTHTYLRAMTAALTGIRRHGRCLACAALLCTTLVGARASAAPAGRHSSGLPKLDLSHLGDYRRALAGSTAPEAVRIRRDIAGSPAILARA